MPTYKKVPSKYGNYVQYKCPKAGCPYSTPYVLSRADADKYIKNHEKDAHSKAKK